MAVRPFADCNRTGDASGMSDPQVCLSGGDRSDRAGVLDAEEVRIKTDA